MLSSMKYMLGKAALGQYAVPHFNVWNVEMLQGVIAAAEETQSPVIISFGSGCLKNTNIEFFAPMMISAAQKASVSVAVHWDHGKDYSVVKQAYELGFNSLMIDASANPLEKNIELTKQVIDTYHPLGIPVEAELGHVGAETIYEDALAKYGYTNPDEAKEFVERTGADCLAIAIGNMHGRYTSKPQIAFHILEKVHSTTSIPLVLHGGSGIGNEDIKTAISLGISKVNVHTELCEAARSAINQAGSESSFMELAQKVCQAVKIRALEKIELFGSAGKTGV